MDQPRAELAIRFKASLVAMAAPQDQEGIGEHARA